MKIVVKIILTLLLIGAGSITYGISVETFGHGAILAIISGGVVAGALILWFPSSRSWGRLKPLKEWIDAFVEKIAESPKMLIMLTKMLVNKLFSSKRLVIAVITVIIIFLGLILYLKEYRLRYCQAKSPPAKSRDSARIKCINDPLYKFIF